MTERRKTGFYQAPADAARLRAAYSATHYQEGYESFSEFCNTVLMREAERLEQTYNDGAPYSSTKPLTPGRPPRLNNV